MRARLENAVNLRLFLTQGLAAYIAQNPEIDTPTFEGMAAILLRQREGIYRISGVRGTVIRYTYPPKDREKILNKDLRTIPGQARILERVKLQRQAVVAGPVRLVEGGRAFINFTPVFVSGTGEYWGTVTTLLHERSLFQEVGLFDVRNSEVYALRGIDGRGDASADLEADVFFGDSALFARDPVLQQALLPNGSWQLAALPRNGWSRRSPNAPWFWAIGSLLGMLVGGAVTRQQIEAARLKAEVAYRLQVEQALQESKQSLEAANRAKSDFLATMSHELRTPLNGILGYTQILQRSPLNQGEEAEALAAIRECASHLLGWIQDILDLAKLEVGKAELTPSIVSLTEVLSA
ncbi:MAG: histidine kinase dimerization/phospho-acceptor domain-containing protein, partial [Pseudanabaenaceae cyanobacterium]